MIGRGRPGRAAGAGRRRVPDRAQVAGVAAQPGTDRYVVCNGAEGEPGTFKDRALMRANPYQLVEGVIIAAFAVGADEAYVALKASFERRARGGHPRRGRDAGGRHLPRLRRSRSSPGPTSTCSARRRRCSR